METSSSLSKPGKYPEKICKKPLQISLNFILIGKIFCYLQVAISYWMIEKLSQFCQGNNQGWTWRSCDRCSSKMGGSIRYFAEGGKARPAGFLRAHVTKKLL